LVQVVPFSPKDKSKGECNDLSCSISRARNPIAAAKILRISLSSMSSKMALTQDTVPPKVDSFARRSRFRIDGYGCCICFCFCFGLIEKMLKEISTKMFAAIVAAKMQAQVISAIRFAKVLKISSRRLRIIIVSFIICCFRFISIRSTIEERLVDCHLVIEISIQLRSIRKFEVARSAEHQNCERFECRPIVRVPSVTSRGFY
jgi:hypothetical protein